MSDVTGLDDLLRNMDRVNDRMDSQIKKGVYKAAAHVLNKTIPVTPISDLNGVRGNLRKSGKIRTQIVPGIGIDGIISFGDGRVDYAAAVHEMPETNNWSEPGTGNKYLEKTLRQESRKILPIIEGEIRI